MFTNVNSTSLFDFITSQTFTSIKFFNPDHVAIKNALFKDDKVELQYKRRKYIIKVNIISPFHIDAIFVAIIEKHTQ